MYLSNLMSKFITKFISHIFGFVSNQRFWGSKLIVKLFCRILKIEIDEAIVPIEGFCTLNSLFTRKLKRNLRPFSQNENHLISPVDGEIVESGKIENNKMVQVKGKYYKIGELLLDPLLSTKYQNGSYITFRLSPRNYHRIHSPLSCDISSIKRIDGALFPVNLSGRKFINNLYVKNERVILELQSNIESFLMIIVGAFLVGSIKLDPKITNVTSIKKGDEIGYFEFGSSVILISKNQYRWLRDSGLIKFGETIGEI